MSGHIVLVVQSSRICDPLIERLAAEGFCALTFHAVEAAVSYLRAPGCPANVAVFAITMRRQSDYVALTELAALRPELQFLITRQGDGPIPELGGPDGRAVEIIPVPLDHPRAELALRRALKFAEEASESAQEAAAAAGSAHLPYSEEFLRRVGVADVPVLLSGETGVGKEVMARRLRSYSPRSAMPFLKVNCAALPPDLAESELFGSVKGAFTGATADRQGRFEMAQGGTLLLDEIGDMDLRMQTKLLHVLQDGEIQPLGSNRVIKVSVRVMAATHRDLTRAIQEGTFREDLYYRLNVIRLVIPPLRERTAEILPLAEALLTRHLGASERAPVMSEDLKRYLISYRWPGNVRELENVMRRFLVYQDSKLILKELLEADADRRPALKVASFPEANVPQSRDPQASSIEAAAAGGKRSERVESFGDGRDPLAEASRVAETELILDALEANRWNRRQAAASLQIDYKAFLYKMQKYGIVAGKRKEGEISA
jgi:DNA-binding NtrC family response regulator